MTDRYCQSVYGPSGRTCNAVIRAGWTRCYGCGAQPEAPKSCVECGKPFPLNLPSGDVMSFCMWCGSTVESRAPTTSDALYLGKMYQQLTRAVTQLQEGKQGKGEKVGTLFFTQDMARQLAFMRFGFRAEQTVASGVDMYCYSNGEWLSERTGFEDVQLYTNPRPFDNPDRPQFRMTNAVAWPIVSGETWRLRITQFLGWTWDKPLHLGGYADLEKQPSETVDPGSFDVRFSGDGIDSWLWGWMLLASVYGKTLGSDAYDDVMRSV